MGESLVDASRGVLALPADASKVAHAFDQLTGACKVLADGGGLTEARSPVLEEAGQGRNGQPLSRELLRNTGGVVDLHASAAAMAQRWTAAISMAEAGLVVLPGDPCLLDLLANRVSDSGDPDRALHILEEALGRKRALGQDVYRVRQTLQDVGERRARLGGAPRPSGS